MRNPMQFFSLEHAQKHNQFPIARFFAGYLARRVPTPVNPLSALALLEFAHPRLNRHCFWVDNVGSALICEAFDLILDTAQDRQKNGERSWGPAKKLQRFRRADLLVEPLNIAALSEVSSVLSQQLVEEALRAVRLLRAAREFCGKEQVDWLSTHAAAGVALARLFETWLALRHHTSPFIARVCLRWALEQVWRLLFGEQAPLPALFDRDKMPLKIERETLRIFANEWKKHQSPPPAPFLGVVQQWQGGNLPPAKKQSAAIEDRARFLV
ncbi:MAG TPA: hypothetical protein VH540_19905 [Ktedonobacterales bacterium]|jgi:hypothetical protein